MFFFNDTATTEIYTLSLHDALPISQPGMDFLVQLPPQLALLDVDLLQDRKSTRLNSSHRTISYAVFCLKKKILPPAGATHRPDRQQGTREPHRPADQADRLAPASRF